jgi:ankyrin repeat protein
MRVAWPALTHSMLCARSGYGWTALHYAGQAKQAGCVALLVAAGTNRALKNNKGKTAHDRAVSQEKVAIAELLA